MKRKGDVVHKKMGMIRVRDYHEMLQKTAREFLVFTIHYVDDLRSWAKQKGIDLHEPAQPMKLMPSGNKLMLIVQEDVDADMLEKAVTAMGVRWSLKDNVSDPSGRLNSPKKKIAYAFLKEYARTLNGVGGDELLEDDWALTEMEKLGLFRE